MGSFLAICCFVFSSSISNWVLWIFFCQQALRRTQICLTVQQILGNSTEENAINFTRKISYFFVAKHYVMEWNFVKIGIWACAHFRIAPWIFIWHVLFGIANFFDHEHKHYWTSVALYSIVAPCKIIRYVPLSDSFRGILASIIEMPHCGKFNSRSVYHSVTIVVKLEIIHIIHVYKINIPWGLVQMFVCLPLEFLVDF